MSSISDEQRERAVERITDHADDQIAYFVERFGQELTDEMERADQ
jgi:hypothetical protein